MRLTHTAWKPAKKAELVGATCCLSMSFQRVSWRLNIAETHLNNMNAVLKTITMEAGIDPSWVSQMVSQMVKQMVLQMVLQRVPVLEMVPMSHVF